MHTIIIDLMDFDTENRRNCELDEFMIYNTDTEDDDNILLKHCGEHLPNKTTYYSTGSKVLIKFSTDSSITGRGFKLNYTMVN